MRNLRKGISPVIATVIIVAVAIAIAVAVAFWITGIVGLYTRYEKLEIINAYADWNDTDGTWIIVLQVRNAGSSDATIDEIFINGRPHDAWPSIYDNNENKSIAYVYEKVALTARDLIINTSDNGWEKTLKNGAYINVSNIKALGTENKNATLTISNSIVSLSSFDFKNGVPLKAGEDMTLVILIPGPGNPYGGPADFKHGSSIEVKIHTAAGKEYPK